MVEYVAYTQNAEKQEDDNQWKSEKDFNFVYQPNMRQLVKLMHENKLLTKHDYDTIKRIKTVNEDNKLLYYPFVPQKGGKIKVNKIDGPHLQAAYVLATAFSYEGAMEAKTKKYLFELLYGDKYWEKLGMKEWGYMPRESLKIGLKEGDPGYIPLYVKRADGEYEIDENWEPVKTQKYREYLDRDPDHLDYKETSEWAQYQKRLEIEHSTIEITNGFREAVERAAKKAQQKQPEQAPKKGNEKPPAKKDSKKTPSRNNAAPKKGTTVRRASFKSIENHSNEPGLGLSPAMLQQLRESVAAIQTVIADTPIPTHENAIQQILAKYDLTESQRENVMRIGNTPGITHGMAHVLAKGEAEQRAVYDILNTKNAEANNVGQRTTESQEPTNGGSKYRDRWLAEKATARKEKGYTPA